MATPSRPQQHRLTWPPTPSQWEAVDEMLQTLFKAQRVTTDAVTTATAGAAVQVSSFQAPPGWAGEDGEMGWPGPPGTPATISIEHWDEIPSGAINSSNALYTTAHPYLSTYLAVHLNGDRLTLTQDYTETSSTSFTMVVAPTTGDRLTVDYIEVAGVTGTIGPIGLTGPASTVPGPPGMVGEPGDDGWPGAPGAASTVPGPTGQQGPPGVGSVIFDGADGDDGWPGPPGAGGTTAGAMVLLESRTASASASLDFTTRNATGQSGATFQSDYDEYEFHLVSLVPASNGVGIYLRFSTDGGATYDATAAHYSWVIALGVGDASPSVVGLSSTSATEIKIHDNQSNAAKLSVSGRIDVFNPLSTALYKLVSGKMNPTDSTRSTSSLISMVGAKWLVDATAGNACQFLASTGNLTSGVIRCYGIAKA